MPQEHQSDGLLLQGRHLTKTFGAGEIQTRALDDVSLDLHAGQVVVLMGPSGSGKSTLLALLSGLLPPTSGQVIARGQDLWTLTDRQRQEFRLRHCGFVFQGFNLFPAMSARQQLEMVLRLGERVPAREARHRTEELLNLFGLGDKAHHRPAEMSGGEKQRVAVARALIKNPTLFFADEPTASLDWERGRQVVQLLCDAAHERKASVLMVSHDPRLRSCADRVYQLDDGRLRESEGDSRSDDTAPDPLTPRSDRRLACRYGERGRAEERAMKRNVFPDGLKPRRGRLLFWLSVLALTVVCLVGAGWALRSHGSGSEPQDSRAEASPAKRSTPVTVGLGQADVEGGVLSLSPTMPGRVAEVLVAENQEVRAGAVLLRLDDEAARAQVEEAQAALTAAEAELAEARKGPRQHQLRLAQQKAATTAARHELAAARLMASRKEELAKKELLNRKEADAAAEEVRKLESAVEAEQAKLDALALRDPAQEVRRAEADVRAKRGRLDRARHALREHTLRAPSDGMILRVLTSPGEALGSQTRQPALLFVPDKPRIVRVEVDQEVVSRVAVGQRAEIEDDAVSGGPTWKGRVVRIAEWFAHRRTTLPDTPTFQDVRTLECIVHLDKGQRPLRIGQRVRVRLFND